MPSSSERGPRLYLEDMLQFCDRDQDTIWSIVSEDMPALRGERVNLLAAL